MVSLVESQAWRLGPQQDTTEKIRESAEQFEGLLVAQMLRHARESGGAGWLGEGSDDSAAPMVEMAEEAMAQVLTRQGGLGLATLVIHGLRGNVAGLDGGTANVNPDQQSQAGHKENNQ